MDMFLPMGKIALCSFFFVLAFRQLTKYETLRAAGVGLPVFALFALGAWIDFYAVSDLVTDLRTDMQIPRGWLGDTLNVFFGVPAIFAMVWIPLTIPAVAGAWVFEILQPKTSSSA